MVLMMILVVQRESVVRLGRDLLHKAQNQPIASFNHPRDPRVLLPLLFEMINKRCFRARRSLFRSSQLLD